MTLVPGTNREKIEQLAAWAADDGDHDVLWICQQALKGDTTLEEQALETWPVWAECQASERRPW